MFTCRVVYIQAQSTMIKCWYLEPQFVYYFITWHLVLFLVQSPQQLDVNPSTSISENANNDGSNTSNKTHSPVVPGHFYQLCNTNNDASSTSRLDDEMTSYTSNTTGISSLY